MNLHGHVYTFLRRGAVAAISFSFVVVFFSVMYVNAVSHILLT